MTKRELVIIPPSVMLRVPVPLTPTFMVPSRRPAPETDKVPESCAPTPKETKPVAPLAAICAVPPLLIRPLLLEFGTPADQLAALNQSPVPSVQIVSANAAEAAHKKRGKMIERPILIFARVDCATNAYARCKAN